MKLEQSHSVINYQASHSIQYTVTATVTHTPHISGLTFYHCSFDSFEL